MNTKSASCKSHFTIPDLFGKRINLLYEEKPYYATRCGQTSTMFILAVLTAALISEGYKFLNQDLVNLSSYETTIRSSIGQGTPQVPFINDSPSQDISSTFIAFGVQTSQELTFGNELQVVLSKEQDKVIDCLTSSYHETLQKLQDVVWYCIEIDQTSLARIRSLIQIKYCTNTEEGSQAEINCLQKLENLKEGKKPLWMEVMIEVNINDVNDNMQTPKYGLQEFRVAAVPIIQKMVQFKLIEYHSITKSGFSTSNSFRSILFKDFHESVLSVGISPDRKLVEIEIERDNHRKLVYKRKLYQFKDAISFLGGLFKGLTILFFLLVWPFREISYYLTMVNQVFRLCDSPENLRKMSSHDIIFKNARKSTQSDSGDSKHATPHFRNNLLHIRSQTDRLHGAKTLREQDEIRELVHCLEEMKHRFKLGGLFNRLIEQDKKEIYDEIEKNLKMKESLIAKSPRMRKMLIQTYAEISNSCKFYFYYFGFNNFQSRVIVSRPRNTGS